ncbi:MAG: hypothetical protein JWQ74_1926 [Marmoricola sp.]|nr:hypothetical protein [Marmoricola sp.]
MHGRLGLVLLIGGLALAGCSNPLHGDTASDRLTPPALGTCRDLEAGDLDQPSNATAAVPCTAKHTAQTFAIGTLPDSTGSAYADKRHGKHVYATCQKAFREFIGAEEGLALRSQLSWAWFRPSERGWDKGARWYRCDLIGGASGASALRSLPAQGKGIFSESLPDTWLTCVRGTTVPAGTKVPCSEPHTWRAVTTIKVGQPGDTYPGDRIVQVRSRDYCQSSVGAWMHYPTNYEYGYTWFHDDRWAAGNRLSICWARTAQ